MKAKNKRTAVALRKEKETTPTTSRARTVLTVVATDTTFRPATSAPDSGWCGKCIHCGTSVFVSVNGDTAATIEHIQPRCNGGAQADPRNLALACKPCNNRKGVDHDRDAGRGGRADEVIRALQARRASRWRDPPIDGKTRSQY